MESKRNKHLDLVLTLDYELYGDGTGDIFKTMIHPTDSFLSICNQYNIKSTIFFEILEFLKIKEEWDKGNKMNYSENPVKAIENQIIQAFKSGHDIQLHIHPHWINARYEDGIWKPDHRYWKLTKVPLIGSTEFPLGLKELIQLGKNSIEEILKPIDPNYKCNIFRAGGYSITPSDKIIECLKSLDFIADSSVIPGAYLNNDYYYYDFKNVPSNKPYWWVDSSVNNTTSYTKEFLEIPIFAKKIYRYSKYDSQRIRIALKNKKSNLTKIKDKVDGKKSLFDKLKFFLEDEYLTWDFCLFSQKKMENFAKTANNIMINNSYQFHPFVLIGHSKEFLISSTFKKFLGENINNLSFYTLKDVVEKVSKNQEMQTM